MKIKIITLIIIGLLGLLTSCAQLNLHPMDMAQAVQTAKTRADHEALAKYYEDAAKETQAKLQEHQKMYEEYEAHRQYYGRRGLDMDAMCRALIHFYGQATEKNMEMAESHRKMAAEAK
ncbi:MAG: hypothetical protein A4S08_05180 [Proteobacteria bacterium SG_bin4]|jgi:hypothetical protein|uniref:hypothetical protein n=1 Tax=Nitrosomonas sp. TaxID=42353 RepID=UPI000A0EAEFE|nr:MAG: hypothetical protein A4S08_05180 [Proteobacteria bacterium SG_bin4]